MKKSILIALAVGAAFGARASLVDWQYMITGQTDSAVPGYTAYLVEASDWEGMKDSVASQQALADVAMDSATFISNGSSGKTGSKVYNFSTQNASGKVAARPVDVGDETSVDAYIVLFDPTANATQASSKMTLVARDGADSPGSSGVLSNTSATVTGGTWAPVGVPEPTTVALLALGLAALGLKRKVA